MVLDKVFTVLFVGINMDWCNGGILYTFLFYLKHNLISLL
jgi:hypothetical protein